MELDQFSLAEKIVKDINYIFPRNLLLTTFEIVPVDKNTTNKSPIMVSQDCLGLESWAVKHVYTFCFSEIKNKFFKRKLSKITSVDAQRLIKLMNVILLLNPDLSTIWNQRREIYLRDLLDLREEFRFTRLVLSRKPKCNDAFAYRRWLFLMELEETEHSIYEYDHLDSIVSGELLICELTAGNCPNNYHSWSHRLWVINQMKEMNKQFEQELVGELYIREYAFTEKWTSKNISDHSCYHYRQFCIKNLLTITDIDHWLLFESTLGLQDRIFVEFIYLNLPKTILFNPDKDKIQKCPKPNLLKLALGGPVKNCTCEYKISFMCKQLDLLIRELFLNNEHIRFYTGHETLWYHRRFIIHEILLVVYEYFGLARINGSLVKVGCTGCNADAPKEPKIVKYDNSQIHKSKFFLSLIAHEKKFIRDRKADCDPYYAERHHGYLSSIEGLKGLA